MADPGGHCSQTDIFQRHSEWNFKVRDSNCVQKTRRCFHQVQQLDAKSANEDMCPYLVHDLLACMGTDVRVALVTFGEVRCVNHLQCVVT